MHGLHGISLPLSFLACPCSGGCLNVSHHATYRGTHENRMACRVQQRPTLGLCQPAAAQCACRRPCLTTPAMRLRGCCIPPVRLLPGCCARLCCLKEGA